MKSNHLIWSCAAFVCLSTLGCFSSPPVWNGTRKLNESKSNIPGPTFSLTILPTGEYHFDNGTYSNNFRCDGKEYTTRPSRTDSCVQTNASEMDMTNKEDGKKIGTAHWELSADGKTLTLKGTPTGTDGTVKAFERIFLRTSQTSGFVGGWKNTKRLESTPQLLSNTECGCACGTPFLGSPEVKVAD